MIARRARCGARPPGRRHRQACRSPTASSWRRLPARRCARSRPRRVSVRPCSNALMRSSGASITDDAGLVELLGEPVLVIPGAADAFKITRPEDLGLAPNGLSLLSRQSGPVTRAVSPSPATYRHRRRRPPVRGRSPVLGRRPALARGPGSRRPLRRRRRRSRRLRRSAVSRRARAISGACSAPPIRSGPGASGVALIGETARLLTAAGWAVGNVAVQLIGTKPRLGARRIEAEARLCADAAGGTGDA